MCDTYTMRKSVPAFVFFCICCTACSQEQGQQSDIEAREPAQQSASDASRHGPNRFFGRDGVVEAQTAIAAGKPPKLYFHEFNGFARGWRTPGIAYCGPYSRSVVEFVGIPELDWSEPNPPRPAPPNAVKFATDFNKTVFKAHEEQIKKVCPQAEIWGTSGGSTAN